MSHFIRGLDEVSKDSIAIVGGKGANLGEMVQAGFRVPPGFCLTQEAYQYFMHKNHIEVSAAELAEDNNRQKNTIRTSIYENILQSEIPNDLAEEIFRAFDARNQAADLVAVRSSATAEDLPEASFAGQQETYLNISRKTLLDHVKKCWASLWTERAVHYRNNNGFEHDKVFLAVVVQKMLPSEVSGVAFSMNPLTNNPDEIIINSAWGLGEGIVAGEVTPDTYIIEKATGQIIKQGIADKEIMIKGSPDGQGIVKESTPADLKSSSSLSENQLKELGELVIKIEQHYHSPQDIEWAFWNHQFYLLQSRPVTTIAKAECFNFDPEQEWTNIGGLKERYIEPLSVLGWSILEPFETVGYKWLLEQFCGKHFPEDTKFFANVYGHIFMNYTLMKENLPQIALEPYLEEDKLGEFRPKRGKFQDKLLGLKILMAGQRLSRRLDKAFEGMLPGFLKEMESLKHKDLDQLRNNELVVYIFQALKQGTEYFKYQTTSLILAEDLYNNLSRMLTKWLKNEDLSLCSKLVSGFPGNLTVETNNDVWKLANELKKIPRLDARLKCSSIRGFLSFAAEDQDGREFLGLLYELLEKHGHKYSNIDIAYQFWGENPEIVLSMVKGLLTSDSSKSPEKREEQKRMERVEAEQFVRLKLTPGQRFVFNKILPLVQKYMLLRDNRNYYVSMPFLQIKRAVNVLAKRLKAAGMIPDEKDIFCLLISEIEDIVKEEYTRDEIRKLLEKRKNAKRIEIDSLPSLFKGYPAIKETAVLQSGHSQILTGIAGSPGNVSGMVKIIRSTDDFAQLKEGDILVAATTNPAWTPLFAIAKAVITNYGGLLSHGAIVAREYGIPAVLGTKNATEILADGQLVTVNGNEGIVILNE